MSASRPSQEHTCHCGKAFARKEHLTRHQATHREPSHICPTCGRSFTRNDLLQRHVILHASPEGRRPRACDACHANKRRCDGDGSPCSLCEKRGTFCRYSRPAPGIIPPSGCTGLDGDLGPQTSTPELAMTLLLRAGTSSLGTTSLEKVNETASDDVKSWFRACADSYFEQLHHYWPFLHSPTFDLDAGPLATTAPLIILGSWCREPSEPQGLRLDVHERLMEWHCETLGRRIRGGGLDASKAWSVEECQAALLSVLFEIHRRRSSTPRASFVMGMLVTTLRALDMLSADAAARQEQTHFPGTFVPYLFTNRELWKRIAICVYRAETLLSLLENRPPQLQMEELDINLPSTFALWNCDGLDIFEQRYEEEPCLRFVHNMHQLVKSPPLNVPPVPLMEDIYQGLCGLWPRVWRYARMRRQNPKNDEPNAEAAWIAEQLDFWKIRLRRFAERCDVAKDTDGPSAVFLRAAYRGLEKQPPSGASDSATRRLEGLLAETVALYHLLGMHTSSDLLALQHLARASPADIGAGEVDAGGHLRGWTGSERGRTALLHAVATLKAREEALTPVREDAAASPVVHAALLASVSVLWAWMIGLGGCTPGSHSGGVVDLAQVARQQDSDEGRWLQDGGSGPIILDGVLLCPCAGEAWSRRFSVVLAE